MILSEKHDKWSQIKDENDIPFAQLFFDSHEIISKLYLSV